jgi:hypothetical protein
MLHQRPSTLGRPDVTVETSKALVGQRSKRVICFRQLTSTPPGLPAQILRLPPGQSRGIVIPCRLQCFSCSAMLLNRPSSLSATFPQFSSWLLASFCGNDGIDEHGTSCVQETGDGLKADSMKAKSSRCERAGQGPLLDTKCGLAMTMKHTERRQDYTLSPFPVSSQPKSKHRSAASWSRIGTSLCACPHVIPNVLASWMRM